MTIAQIVYDNERYFFSHDDIHEKVGFDQFSTLKIVLVMRRITYLTPVITFFS